MYHYFLCFRYVTRRYIGLVSILSTMIGVSTMIVVNSIMFGFGEKMRERLHGVQADIILESVTMDGMPQSPELINYIKDTLGDELIAWAPTVEVPAIMTNELSTGHEVHRPIMLVGIDASARALVGDFSKHLLHEENRKQPEFKLHADALDWRLAHPQAIDQSRSLPLAIVGFQLATYRMPGSGQAHWMIDPGQEIKITTVRAGQPSAIRTRPDVSERFIVCDFYRSEMSEYDSKFVFVPIESLQLLRGMGTDVTHIQLKIRDYSKAKELVAALQSQLNPMYFRVMTWEERQGALLEAVQVERAIMNVILFFILCNAGFGVLAVFFMIVIEKTRDIGILKALGASNRGVMSIFLMYGFCLGLIGSILGTLLGVWITLNRTTIEEFLNARFGIEIFPRNIYYFDEIPAILDPWTVTWIVLGAMAVAVGAAVLPARRAARLNPVEALRYE